MAAARSTRTRERREDALDVSATAGTVTVTELTSTEMTYSLTFAAEGTLTGAFDVMFCALAPAMLASPTLEGECD
jgi:hypothetical protein